MVVAASGCAPRAAGRVPAALARCARPAALDNVLEHGQSEGSPRIAIEGERFENCVRYSIADNGPGVEQECREQLFHVFERLTTVGEGTGGRAWIEETPGGGCCVLFELPAGVSS